MQREKCSKSLQTEILPKKLTHALDALGLKGTKRATSIQICSRILALQARKKLLVDDYIQVAKTYWEKIDTNYSRALNILKAAGIVEVWVNADGTKFSAKKHFAIAYRVSPELIDQEVAEIQYETKCFKTSNLSPQEEEWILSDLQALKIDAETARHELNDYLTYLDLAEWEITPRSYEYLSNAVLATVRFGKDAREYVYKTKALLDTVLGHGEHVGKKLYRLGEYYVIDTPHAFKARKVESIRKRYGQALNAFQGQKFYGKRVDINNRVHHNLTECPTWLLDYITVDEEALEEVDVRNSQLACLAHVMRHGDVLGLGTEFPTLQLTGQSRAFLEACQSGSIYSDLAQLLGTRRDIAKTEMFRILFGGIQASNLAWQQLQVHYAPVAQWLTTVKGKINLAHYLQKVEANIMVENVYPALKNVGLFALSKHDSFLVPSTQVEAAQMIVEAEFARLGYVATLKNKVTQQLELAL